MKLIKRSRKEKETISCKVDLYNSIADDLQIERIRADDICRGKLSWLDDEGELFTFTNKYLFHFMELPSRDAAVTKK